MNLFKSESDRYTKEHLSAREAQRQAEYIACLLYTSDAADDIL